MKAPIDFFIAHLTAQNMQPMTLQQYGSFLIRFDRYLDQTYGLKLTPEDISKITGAHLSTYMQELTSLNRKISTRNNYIIILRRFFSCMKEAGFITDDPSRILHSAREKMTPELRRERSEKRYTTQDIVLLLEEMLGEHPRMTDLRDAAILALILASGLRASEVCALDVRQLQEMKAGVLFCLRKGGDWEEVSVAAFAIPYIERYLSARNQPEGNTPMFVSQKGTRLTRQAMWESFHAKQQRANLKSGIHILRHTLVTFVDHNGGSAIARDVAGHSSVRITDGYMHTSIDERREAISAAPYVAQLEKQLQTS